MIKLMIVIASLLWRGSSYATVVKCPSLSRCGDQRIHAASWRGPSTKAPPPYRVEIDKNHLSEFKGNLELKYSCASYIYTLVFGHINDMVLLTAIRRYGY